MAQDGIFILNFIPLALSAKTFMLPPVLCLLIISKQISTILLTGNDLSYQKLGSNVRTLPDLHYMDNDDIPTSALDLEWDMETELDELGTEQFQSDGFIHCHEKNSSPTQSHAVASNQLSISPKGRFQRLEEEPEYFSHYTESKSKTSQNLCTIIKTFSIFMFTFLFGILIGYFSNRNPTSSSCNIPNEPDSSSAAHIIDEIVKDITKENIEQYYRYFTQISVNKTDPAKNIALLWTSIGLKEVQLLNYSVLLDLPGSSPNTITLNNGQCYYPSGQQCDEETKSQEYLYTYAAFSANGSLEGEVIDVQYATVEDLLRVTKLKKIYKTSIALLKLGFLPLKYKLSLLEEIGFGGVLIYIDPCDIPETQTFNDKAFMVSLKSGGFPFTSSDYIIGPAVAFFTPSCLPIADAGPAWCMATILFLVYFDSSLVFFVWSVTVSGCGQVSFILITSLRRCHYHRL
ncbi:hypothetical protein GDO81_007612 [Engystomops pustulosus]|uniref:Uncharacterized protein n=1 Tax=Engystomops pustulosus TaxID=76066 RepID=A0AAV7C8D5_ENGPU|nr:hypothetical protein GDO81_007612 [Engystomops pustulosus]